MSSAQLVKQIGTRVLPFMNPRVVSPPGIPVTHGRPNIIVATPKRSGTHVLIDLILNNMPAYRNKPLYINMDRCWKLSTPTRDLIAPIKPDVGYVIKTHIPVGLEDILVKDPRLLDVINSSIIVTVRRDQGDISRSLNRWRKTPTKEDAIRDAADYAQFWDFWGERSDIELAFSDLFTPEPMQAALDQLCEMTNTQRKPRFTGPPSRKKRNRIYVNKALTRLFGRHAPRADTTIHTLKA